MNADSDKIKQLLLADELALLEQLRQKVLESDHFSDEVAQVLARATGRAWKNDPAYKAVLAKPIGEGLKTALKREQRSIIDAFVPVIGPMIRASVSASIKKLMADINRVLELGFSPKALKWRWQSWKTGVPFAELVFLNTVEYQVQHLFLIDKHSGMLIEYAGHEEDLARDKDAFSAMLTAIGDFVADTLADDSAGRLRSAELGEYQLWIIDGPKAYLAALIKGSPSERLREQLQDALEKIHFLYDDELGQNDQFGNLPAIRLELEEQLVTKTRQDDEESESDASSTRKAWLLGLALLGLVAFFGWRHYQQNQRLENLRQQWQQVPGFVLHNIEKSGRGWLITGLQDPLADLSAAMAEDIRLQTRPYLSLEPAIVQRRAQRLTDEAGLSLSVDHNGTAVLAGQAPAATRDALRARLLAMPGITTVDTSQVVTAHDRWLRFVESRPLADGLTARFSTDRLVLEGTANAEQLAAWLTAFQAAFPGVKVDTSTVRPSADDLIRRIESTFIAMPRGTKITANANEQLKKLAESITALWQQQPEARIVLTGQTDCTGSLTVNQHLARLRAEHVKQALQALGLNSAGLQITAQPCTDTNNSVDASRRGVSFRVIHPGISDQS